VELSREPLRRLEVFVSHANAALTPRARLKLARLIVDQQWPVARAAERYDVSWPTAKRWADRYRQLGPDGMADRSSRPHRSPGRTPQPLVRKVVHLRWKHRLGPVQIAARTGLAPSTVHAVLVRCRLSRLAATTVIGAGASGRVPARAQREGAAALAPLPLPQPVTAQSQHSSIHVARGRNQLY
jgi:leucine-zipper of insertion element IS481